jgi:hypothetical protein
LNARAESAAEPENTAAASARDASQAPRLATGRQDVSEPIGPPLRALTEAELEEKMLEHDAAGRTTLRDAYARKLERLREPVVPAPDNLRHLDDRRGR